MSDNKRLTELKKQLKDLKYCASIDGKQSLFIDQLAVLKADIAYMQKRVNVQKALKTLKKKGYKIFTGSGLPV